MSIEIFWVEAIHSRDLTNQINAALKKGFKLQNIESIEDTQKRVKFMFRAWLIKSVGVNK